MSKTYERITNAIIQRLEQGVVPWRRPWTHGPPRNLVSRKPYRGVNALLLGAQGHEQPWWLTYRQAQQLGGHVTRGEHGTTIVYWQPQRQDEDGTMQRAFLRAYTVFNVAQCTGLTAPEAEHRDEDLDTILNGMADPPRLTHNGNRASYHPATDTITLPRPASFTSTPAYYATLYHELTHSTGHETRLARPGITQQPRFGTPGYAQEELIAEIGAAFLCAHGGISPATIENTAGYLDHWLTVLHEQPRLLVRASSGAQHATDYILGEGT